MSLYNMVFGTQLAAPVVLAILQKDACYFGRFRDAWVEKDHSGNIRLAVYTRNGGGNREHYNDESEYGPQCDCTGCIITHRLPSDPLYIGDIDDDLDCTYCTVYFRSPDDLIERLKTIGAPDGFKIEDMATDGPVNMSDAWVKAIEAIGQQ